MMPEEKDGLLKLIESRLASTFDPTNVALHGSTNYITWKDQEGGTFVDLPCVRSDQYEPFLALRYCRELPPFQEGFSAIYGQSTVSIICCVHFSQHASFTHPPFLHSGQCSFEGLATNFHKLAVPSSCIIHMLVPVLPMAVTTMLAT